VKESEEDDQGLASTTSTSDDRGAIIILSSLSVVLSFGGVLSCIVYHPRHIMQVIETIFIFVEAIFWTGAATVSAFAATYDGTNPQQPTSINDYTIKEPNIYFFTFLSICFCIFLLASWVKEHYVKDDTSLTTQWMFMATMGFTTMISSLAYKSLNDKDDGSNSNSNNNNNTAAAASSNTTLTEESSTSVLFCEVNDDYSCRRLIYAVTLGGITGAVSCVIVLWKTAPRTCQAEVAMLLLIAWTCAIGLVTFPPGPAIYVSTLYIATYICFFVSLNILTISSLSASSSTRLSTQNGNDRTDEVAPAGAAQEVSSFDQQEQVGEEENSESHPSGPRNEIFDVAYDHLVMNQERRNSSSFTRPRLSIFESVGAWESFRTRRSSSTTVVAADKGEGGRERGEIPAVETDRTTTPNTTRTRTTRTSTIITTINRRKRDRRRVGLWPIIIVESIICLCSYLPYFDSEMGERDGVEKWIVTIPSISIAASCIGFLASHRQKMFTYLLEGVLVSYGGALAECFGIMKLIDIL
jgi:hypothetical protein